MLKPWVSILTPVYNGVEFLEHCAISVVLQKCRYNNIVVTWEWWIGINGHGEDGGEAMRVAETIQQKYQLLLDDCVIHVVNLPKVKGKVEALNTLVPLTNGEWIAILDCDDVWDKDKLIIQHMSITPQIDVIGTYCKYFGDFVSDGPVLPGGYIPVDVFSRMNPMINSSVLIRRELAHWEDRFGLEDYDLWLRLVKGGAKLFNVPYTLVHHRIHKASAFNGKGGQDVAGLLAFHASRPPLIKNER